MGAAPELRDTQINLVRERVYQLAGIRISAEKRSLVAGRIQKRMRALNFRTPDQYLAHLEKDPAEVEHFINAMTTNLTYFFREEVVFPVILKMMSRRMAAGQRKFRIWCGASSTGEEPYSLAMLLQQQFGGRYLDLAILATDIDTEVLQVAQRGVYPRKALERVPPELRRKAFERHGEQVRVVDSIRRMVRFARLNLSETPYPMTGPLDVILCRNVMIYFDEPVQNRVVHEFERLVSPTGMVVVGHSETLKGVSRHLEMEHPSVYVRAGRKAA